MNASTVAAPRGDQIAHHTSWFAGNDGRVTRRSIMGRFVQLGFPSAAARIIARIFDLRFNAKASNPDGKGMKPDLLVTQAHNASTQTWRRQTGSFNQNQLDRVMTFLDKDGHLTRSQWQKLISSNGKRDDERRTGRTDDLGFAQKWFARLDFAKKTKDTANDLLGSVTGNLEFALMQRVKRLATGDNEALIGRQDLELFFKSNQAWFNSMAAAKAARS